MVSTLMTSAMQTREYNTITAIPRAAWNRLFPTALEDWDYYAAVERSGLAGFAWIYFTVSRGEDLRAVVPAFVTSYRLDTTLQGALKRISDALSRTLPGVLQTRLLSLGSPVSEVCDVGFAADCTEAERIVLLGHLLDGAAHWAEARSIGMLAIKDAADQHKDLFMAACTRRRLRALPGLPTAILDIPFLSIDEYFRSLGHSTRRDLRRKSRAFKQVDIVWRTDIHGIEKEILQLYRATRQRSELRFEELTLAYFCEVLALPGSPARCVTYSVDGRVAAFNLVIAGKDTLLDKFFGMDDGVGRAHNLYYLSWVENVRHCIEGGLHRYQSGQGLHREKVRLGSRLTPNSLWYRHRNPLLDLGCRLAERLFRLDRLDPDFALGPGGRT